MTQVEGWPGLMSTEMATRYLSVEEARFLKIASRFGIPAVDAEDGSTRWRKQDLDRLIKRLPSVAAPPASSHMTHHIRIEENHIEAIADAVAERLRREPSVSGRKLVSIIEASELLGLGRTTIYRMIGEGQLATSKIGRRTLVHMDTINSVICNK